MKYALVMNGKVSTIAMHMKPQHVISELCLVGVTSREWHFDKANFISADGSLMNPSGILKSVVEIDEVRVGATHITITSSAVALHFEQLLVKWSSQMIVSQSRHGLIAYWFCTNCQIIVATSELRELQRIMED